MYLRDCSLISLVTAVMATICAGIAPVQVFAGPEAEFIAAGLADQEQACGASLEVEYTGDWTKSVGQQVQAQRVCQYGYSRTASFQRVVVEEPDQVTITGSYDRSADEFRILRREQTGRTTGEIGAGKGDALTVLNSFETARYPLYEGVLRDRIKLGAVAELLEIIDGHECNRVEIPSSKGSLEKYVVWVDPSIGFNPRRIDFVWKDKQPTVVKFFDYFQESPGLWIPRKQTVEYVSRFMTDATFKITNTVTKVSVGRSIPDDEMRTTFPSGAIVQIPDGEFTAP